MADQAQSLSQTMKPAAPSYPGSERRGPQRPWGGKAGVAAGKGIAAAPAAKRVANGGDTGAEWNEF